jgi:hypothetical protein
MFHHGFIHNMEFIGDGEDADNFMHNHGKTNCVGQREYKAFACHNNIPRMDTSFSVRHDLVTLVHCPGGTFS